jgi:hypothetical protein
MYQDSPAIRIMRTAKRLRRQNAHAQIKVLKAYAEDYYGPEDFYFQSFAPIMAATGLPRERVKFLSRLLQRGGWLVYGKGLWRTDDGGPAGAGYALTPMGHALLELVKEKP